MNAKTAGDLQVDCLYHYQSFEKPERLARIFTDKTIYFSKPEEFNDPWDCRPFIKLPNLKDPFEFEQVTKSASIFLYKKNHLEYEEKFKAKPEIFETCLNEYIFKLKRRIRELYRIYCLTTDPYSIIMWSHYARSHTGVCLEYNVENDIFHRAIQVNYREYYLPLFELFDANEDEEIQPLISKSSAWDYEKEFRLFATDDSNVFPDLLTTKNGCLKLPKGVLKAVIIGCQMPKENKELIRCLVEGCEEKVNFKEAVLLADRYALEIREAADK